MNTMFRAMFAIAAIAMPLAIGCQPNAPAPASTSAAEKKDQTATITRRGGIAGVNDRAIIFVTDGDFNLHTRNSVSHGQLPTDALADLKSALEATGSLKDSYPADRRTADAFEYTLAYRGRTIRWSEAAVDLPQALAQVADLFGRSFAATGP